MQLSGLVKRAGAILLVGGLCACANTPPEEALREVFDVLQRDIRERRADAVGSLLADDFVGNEGMDRRAARQLITAMFVRYRDVAVRFGPLQVQMQGDTHATVRFTAFATGGAGGLLPQDAQAYEVTTGWRNDDGDWFITSAHWQPKL